MIIKTKALVLKEYTIGESDKFVTLFTKEHGKIQVKASRAKKSDKGLAAATQPFVYGEFLYKSYKNTYSLISVDIIEMFQNIRSDFESICYASYITEFLDFVVQDNQSQPELLHLALMTLQALSKQFLSFSLIRSIFELRALKELGFMPQLLNCVCCGTVINKQASFYFSYELGGVVCKKCYKITNKQIITIDYGTYYTIQYILTSHIKILFHFNITQEIETQLNKICCLYMPYYIEHTFKSLELLKKSP